eukprot:CAMPEP_0170627874 /NCGR_PEP_ID=MMETSP0224-20130122/32287_1 /TAXON_ID=285029 /ORGANISM="Togula jolla, Strain CCCM 725" /LENGTH=167 /DNA_ID=CAMNT_0010955069 /DNA_START=99 /DNA_END=602 /DNA_ORIENTATION=+
MSLEAARQPLALLGVEAAATKAQQSDCLRAARPTSAEAPLSDRLAARGLQLPATDDPGRACGPAGPAELVAAEGSARLRREVQGLGETVLRMRTVSDLRQVCRLTGMATEGTKDELIRRLVYDAKAETVERPTKRRRASISSAFERGDRESAVDSVAVTQRRRRKSI